MAYWPRKEDGMLKPYKFLVQAIVQQVDDDGTVVAELGIGGQQQGEPAVLFGVDSLVEWAREFPAKLDEAPIS